MLRRSWLELNNVCFSNISSRFKEKQIELDEVNSQIELDEVIEKEKAILNNIIGIPNFALPMRYLRKLLTTKQISSHDCRTLVEQERSVDSWVWRKILALREILRPYVKYRVGNGKSVKCLHDNWSSDGDISAGIEPGELAQGRRLTESVLRCKNNLSEGLTDAEDGVVWFGDNKYQTSKAWDHIRDKPEPVWWWKISWFSGNVPKFSFIVWLLFLGRLPTKDRLKN
ncbi:hypothetical protein LIER_20987 [Lithospermum erythrorhizon]|uniref:Reverse transcriptase zinc-binding domain-containing protein n=1 Tax=Lithospermum erythrorhizon TaxID=34254 RepID=A0AAV3QNL3_LITER